MLTGNTLRSAIRCTATWWASDHVLRGHPLRFHANARTGPGGGNRGAMGDVLPHARNFPPEISGWPSFFFGLRTFGRTVMRDWLMWLLMVGVAVAVPVLLLFDVNSKGAEFDLRDATFWALVLPWHGWNLCRSVENGWFALPWRRGLNFPVQNDRGQ